MSKYLIDGRLYNPIRGRHEIYEVADDYQIKEKSEID